MIGCSLLQYTHYTRVIWAENRPLLYVPPVIALVIANVNEVLFVVMLSRHVPIIRVVVKLIGTSPAEGCVDTPVAANVAVAAVISVPVCSSVNVHTIE